MNTGFIPVKDKAAVKRVIRIAIRLLQRIRDRLPGFDSSDDRARLLLKNVESPKRLSVGAARPTHRQEIEDEALAILGDELLKEHRESGEESIQFASLLEEVDYQERDGNENSAG